MKPGKDEATAQTTQQNRTSLDSLFIKDDESEGCSSRQGQKRLLTQPSLDAAPSSVDVEGEQEGRYNTLLDKLPRMAMVNISF